MNNEWDRDDLRNELLFEIDYRFEQRGITRLDGLKALMEVVGHIAANCFVKDAILIKMREEEEAKAKRDLLDKLHS